MYPEIRNQFFEGETLRLSKVTEVLENITHTQPY